MKNKLDAREDAFCKGKFYVITEKWSKDGTWYTIGFAEKKTWLSEDGDIGGFRDKREAQNVVDKLNETIGWTDYIGQLVCSDKKKCEWGVEVFGEKMLELNKKTRCQICGKKSKFEKA